METAYLALASAVFALHLVFVLAVAPSTAALCRGYYRTRPLFLLTHCTFVYSMGLTQLLLRACPLVPLEHMLRESGGGAPWYSGSFILFVVERVTGLHLPVALIASLSILIVVLTTAALLEARLRVAGGDVRAVAAR